MKKLFFLLISIVFISGCTSLKSDFYPDTEDAPVLEFVWNGDLQPDQVRRITPYGVWEGWFEYENGIAYEPANEMQFYVDSTEPFPVLSVSKGIVVRAEEENKMVIIRCCCVSSY